MSTDKQAIARACALIVAQVDRQIIRSGLNPYTHANRAQAIVKTFVRADWARIALLAAVDVPTHQVIRLVQAVYAGRVLALDSLRAS